jgi:hypothetical protein
MLQGEIEKKERENKGKQRSVENHETDRNK